MRFVLIILLAVFYLFADTLYVEGISFIGNDNVSRSTLLSQMLLKQPQFFTRSRYSFSVLTDDIYRIERFYSRIGYLNAKVQIAAIVKDTMNQSARIKLRVDEGVQTIVDSVIVKSNRVFSDSALRQMIPLKNGDVLDSITYSRSTLAIQDSLQSRGYLFVDVSKSIDYNENRDRAVLLYRVNEGPVVKLSGLEITGAESVNRKVIRRELVIDEDQVVTSRDITRSVGRLYSSGLFNYVRIAPLDSVDVPSDADTVAVPFLVQLMSAKTFQLQTGGGYNTEDGLYATLETTYGNLFGLNQDITLSGRVSFDIVAAQLIYHYPYFLNSSIMANYMLYIERRDEPQFSGLFRGGIATLSGRLTYYSWYRTWIRIQNTAWLQGDVPPEPAAPARLQNNLALLGLGIVRDSRDNVVLTRNGLYGFIETELAGPGIGWSDKFYRIRGDIRGYLSTFNNNLTYSASLFAGYTDGYSGSDVPVPELFRVGEAGVRPVRGYTDEGITPAVQASAAVGKLAAVVTPVQLAFHLYSVVRGVVFLDGGYIWPSLDNFNIADLKWAAGPGIRVVLPFGIVRLDYGIRLDGSPGLDGRLHFGLGAAF